ncbi:MAG: hypothetical protein KDC98_26235, partial [Planctomycetes bacterium]|nr:hypothetical protein [Planctomycetota bacterium]
MRATGLPQFLAAWDGSRLAKLLAEPDVAPAAAAVMRHLRAHVTRSRQVIEAAVALELQLEPYRIASLFGSPNLAAFLGHPFAEARSLEFVAFQPPEGSMRPLFVIRRCCLPQFEGRWTMAFEKEMAALLRSPWFRCDRDAKIGGNPAVTLQPMADEEQAANPSLIPLGLWKQHLPGTFLHGTGTIAEAEAMRLSPPEDSAQVAITMDLRQYLAMFANFGGAMPQGFKVLGFDALDYYEWRWRFVEDLLLSEVEVGFSGEAGGLVGALLNHAAPLPAQALPDGALVQLRTAIDFKTAIATIREAARDDLPLSEEHENGIVAALTGGVAFAVSAPAPGGLIPRLFLTLGIADEERARGLVDAVLAPLQDSGAVKKVN